MNKINHCASITEHENTERSLLLWAAASCTQGLGQIETARLASSCGLDPEKIWEELQKMELSGNRKKEIKLPSLDALHKDLDLWRETSGILTPSNPAYPPQLLHLPDFPLLLFIRGNCCFDYRKSVSVVGSRSATAYGLSSAFEISRQLALSGAAVVSGLARGVDSYAHRGALDGGGFTAAVLGCGIDLCYPRENERLKRRIAETGLIISEYPGKTPPAPYRFPLRNRIIAALSSGTLAIQASYKSGAMITADLAAQLGRTVMALPGQINCLQSQGTLELIFSGAVPVRGGQDVMDSLGIFKPENKAKAPLHLSTYERKVIKALEDAPRSAPDLLELTGFTVETLSGVMRHLEDKLLVRRMEDFTWIRLPCVE